MCIQGAVDRFRDRVDTDGTERKDFGLDRLGERSRSLKQAKMKEAQVWRRESKVQCGDAEFLEVERQVDMGFWSSEKRFGLEEKNVGFVGMLA